MKLFKHYDYQSAEHLLGVAESPCDLPDRMRSSIQGYGGESGRPLPEAIKAARLGDAASAGTWERMAHAELPSGRGGSRWVTGPAGCAPHVPNYVRGDIRHSMLRRVKSPYTGRMLRVVIDVGASSYTEDYEFQARGVAVLALVDHMETIGARCEVTFVNGNQNRIDGEQQFILITFPLKRFEDPFDIGALAFWLADPSVLRRLIFSHREHEPADVRRKFGYSAEGGYGQSMFVSTDIEVMKRTLELQENDIYMPALHGSSKRPYINNPVRWAQEIAMQQAAL